MPHRFTRYQHVHLSRDGWLEYKQCVTHYLRRQNCNGSTRHAHSRCTKHVCNVSTKNVYNVSTKHVFNLSMVHFNLRTGSSAISDTAAATAVIITIAPLSICGKMKNANAALPPLAAVAEAKAASLCSGNTSASTALFVHVQIVTNNNYVQIVTKNDCGKGWWHVLSKTARPMPPGGDAEGEGRGKGRPKALWSMVRHLQHTRC